MRQRQWGPDPAVEVRRLREGCHGLGKDKVAPLQWEDAETISISTVGGILQHLKARGLLLEPDRRMIRFKRRPEKRPYAIHKHRRHTVTEPENWV